MSEDETPRIIAETIAAARPPIQADSADIAFAALRGQRVEAPLTGKCPTCTLAGQTLGGVRRKLMQALDRPVMVAPLIA
jgi:Fe-S cluster biogenesis protein NfuA